MGRPKRGLLQVANYHLIDINSWFQSCPLGGLVDLASMKDPTAPWRRSERKRAPRLLPTAR